MLMKYVLYFTPQGSLSRDPNPFQADLSLNKPIIRFQLLKNLIHPSLISLVMIAILGNDHREIGLSGAL